MWERDDGIGTRRRGAAGTEAPAGRPRAPRGRAGGAAQPASDRPGARSQPPGAVRTFRQPTTFPGGRGRRGNGRGDRTRPRAGSGGRRPAGQPDCTPSPMPIWPSSASSRTSTTWPTGRPSPSATIPCCSKQRSATGICSTTRSRPANRMEHPKPRSSAEPPWPGRRCTASPASPRSGSSQPQFQPRPTNSSTAPSTN